MFHKILERQISNLSGKVNGAENLRFFVVLKDSILSRGLATFIKVVIHDGQRSPDD